jgi:CBS domain-containing protein
MLIAQILRQKGGEVVSVAPEASIAELAALLKRRNIGAAVVTDGAGELVGIISERDLARGLADHGAGLCERPVAELMTAEVVTSGLDRDLASLMQLMTDRRIRHLPVVEGGALVGIISIGDVVKHRLQELEEEKHSLEEYITSSR